MLDFSRHFDLPLIWYFIQGIAIFLYVLLDGFDLGIGILFPFAPSGKCRNRMMNSIAPFWDGNETWLVLGGIALFGAFPLAYSTLLPAFYIPIILMLLGLILRGVAFEFRFKTDESHRKIWDYVFHFGSLIAAFCQGAILGAYVKGVNIDSFGSLRGAFDWASAFSIMTGIALIFGYALLGSTWLIMKTEDITQSWAKKVASYVLGFVGFFLALVSICVPYMDERIKRLWFSIPNIYYLAIIPLCTLALFVLIWRDLHRGHHEVRMFFCSLAVFFTGFLGLGISIFPWIIPYQYTIWDAAAVGSSLSLMLCGVGPLLPIILGYTVFSYYVFRGKSGHDNLY